MTGRSARHRTKWLSPMKGWLLVDADSHAEDEDLRRWVDRGLAYANFLPPK